jgi:hypothetical protein
MTRTLLAALTIAGISRAAGARAAGQAPAVPQPTARLSAKAEAPIDLTGYWVSIITEDWRWRMVTPPKGDYMSIPINEEAKRVGDAWNPAKDVAAGLQCKSYGAAAIMRVPGRLHITWQDDNTLKVETDAGMQTRTFHFGNWKAPAGKPTWQGDSVAEWVTTGDRDVNGEMQAGMKRPDFGSLKVVTTHMRPGYLRKNGVPYSGDAVMTEYWDLYKEKNGDQWLVVTSTLHDPKYLQIDYITSPNFSREADGSKWDPTPCSATW